MTLYRLLVNIIDRRLLVFSYLRVATYKSAFLKTMMYEYLLVFPFSDLIIF